MSDKKDKDIKNFIINYEDGTSKTVAVSYTHLTLPTIA